MQYLGSNTCSAYLPSSDTMYSEVTVAFKPFSSLYLLASNSLLNARLAPSSRFNVIGPFFST